MAQTFLLDRSLLQQCYIMIAFSADIPRFSCLHEADDKALKKKNILQFQFQVSRSSSLIFNSKCARRFHANAPKNANRHHQQYQRPSSFRIPGSFHLTSTARNSKQKFKRVLRNSRFSETACGDTRMNVLQSHVLQFTCHTYMIHT